ncbi:MAG TPA: hypothetical protein VI750_11420, partial [Pyrinomonadaceae bacterium]|nr:hypothetical protein [Pyrinomonadaceae bacterium]
CVEIAGNAPRPGGRVVQFRAASVGVVAPRDQDFAVGQQRCGVIATGRVEIAGSTPRPSGWIIQLCAVKTARMSRDHSPETPETIVTRRRKALTSIRRYFFNSHSFPAGRTLTLGAQMSNERIGKDWGKVRESRQIGVIMWATKGQKVA